MVPRGGCRSAKSLPPVLLAIGVACCSCAAEEVFLTAFGPFRVFHGSGRRADPRAGFGGREERVTISGSPSRRRPARGSDVPTGATDGHARHPEPDRMLLRRLQSRRLERDARSSDRRRRARSQSGTARDAVARRSARFSRAWTAAIRSSCATSWSQRRRRHAAPRPNTSCTARYKVGDEGLPAAHGQTYVLPGGAFFDVRDGRIARVTNYYNLAGLDRAGRRRRA